LVIRIWFNRKKRVKVKGISFSFLARLFGVLSLESLRLSPLKTHKVLTTHHGFIGEGMLLEQKEYLERQIDFGTAEA